MSFGRRGKGILPSPEVYRKESLLERERPTGLIFGLVFGEKAPSPFFTSKVQIARGGGNDQGGLCFLWGKHRLKVRRGGGMEVLECRGGEGFAL